jgi:hypothetical protein
VRPAPRQRDRGAAFSEYAAVILLLAAVAGVVVVAVPGSTEDLYETAICRIEQLRDAAACPDGEGDGGEDEEPYPHDLSPGYCVRDGREERYGYELGIGWFKFGQQYKFSQEELSDGTFLVTFLPETEAGVVAGVGWDFGKENALATTADVEGSVSAKLAPGMTYIFKSREEFAEFEDEVEAAITEEMNRQMNPESQIGLGIADWLGVYDPPEIRNPDVRSGTISGNADLAAAVGLWTGNNDVGKPTPSETLDGYDLNLGADGTVSYNRSMNVSHMFMDPDNQQTSYTQSFTATGSLGGNLLSARNGVEASWNGGQRVVRNEDGSLASIRYMMTLQNASEFTERGRTGSRENGGGVADPDKEITAVRQMVQLDFDTPEEQAIGERLLDERGLLPPESALDFMTPEGDDLIGPDMDERTGGTINREPAPGAPDWERFLYEQGRVWQYQMDGQSQDTEISAELKLGLQLGASANWGVEERHTSRAEILDRPRNGERAFIDYPDCLSRLQPPQEEGE